VCWTVVAVVVDSVGSSGAGVLGTSDIVVEELRSCGVNKKLSTCRLCTWLGAHTDRLTLARHKSSSDSIRLTFVNHAIASESPPGTRSASLGVSGGKMHQRLRPEMSAFHADVARGSMCMPVPDLGGPMRNQRYGGRLLSPHR
jgi:hypothetical protein